MEGEMAEKKLPGAVLAIVQDGRIVYSAGFGIANADTSEPVRAEMLFRAGSTSKMMTAAALVKLSLEGKISLDEPIGNKLPSLPPPLRPLTAKQLLSHTSGLIPDTSMFGPHDDEALEKSIMRWESDRFLAKPGEKYSYSNHGYALAGLIVEKLSGKAYADAVTDLVFQPVGMQRTTFRPLVAMTWPLAQGHDEKGHVIRPAADNTAFWPAGSMYTSVLEFSQFLIAFMDGGQGKIDPRVITAMTTPVVDMPKSDAKYGLGLQLSTFHGHERWSHNGSRAGYTSVVMMAPELKTGFVLMMNRSGGALPKTVEKLQEMLFVAQ